MAVLTTWVQWQWLSDCCVAEKWRNDEGDGGVVRTHVRRMQRKLAESWTSGGNS